MAGRVRSVSSYQRRLLDTGWEMCSTQPGALEDPSAFSDANVEWLPIGRPATAAGALRSLGKWTISDAPRRFDAQDWWFRVRFSPFACGPADRLILGLDGIATVCDVWLNGTLVLTSDNMFVTHELLVDPAIQNNELVIRCRSLDALLMQKRPRPRWRAPMVENQQLRWFRTTLLGRTPGWSPSAAAVGPWRDVWLERRRHVEVSQLRLNSRIDDGQGVVNIAVQLAGLGSNISSCTLTLQRGETSHRCDLSETSAGIFGGQLLVDQPELWWPHTHGSPALYSASLSARTTEGSVAIGLGAIAFRSIEVRTDDNDFAISVNDVPVFCRGACWTPLDIVTLSSDETANREIFDQIVDAGMNMLRIGGTMVYEDDTFLDECDRRGVLLWQDFMFANMDYPADDVAFDSSARKEVLQQLERLQARPSVAVLCGNSEGAQQAAMWGASRELWQPAFFHRTLPSLCADICRDTAYWPSSAFGGSFPHQPDCGTTSYYGVGAYLRPLDDARRSEVRFASECLAFANVPETGTIATMPGGHALRVHHAAWKAASPRDLGAGWDFEDVRDHYLRTLFAVDPVALRYADHDRYLDLSRVVSAEVMAATFAEWRRGKSQCHGALIWFLRDLVPGAGWGIIDALGKPKAPYYLTRRALQPRAVFISDEGVNGPYVHLINETPEPLSTSVSVNAYKSSVTVATATRQIELQPHSSCSLSALEWFDGFRDLSWAYRFGPPTADLLVATLGTPAESVIGESFYFPLGLSASTQPEVGLSASVRMHSEDEFELTISTRDFAQWVQIEVDGFVVSDQYFHLTPHAQKSLKMRRHSGVKPRDIRGTVRALNSKENVRITIE